MAKAKRVEQVTAWVPAYVLEMSQEEAQTLRDLLAETVTGVGRRQFTDSIYEALMSAGVRMGNKNDIHGVVTFKA